MGGGRGGRPSVKLGIRQGDCPLSCPPLFHGLPGYGPLLQGTHLPFVHGRPLCGQRLVTSIFVKDLLTSSVPPPPHSRTNSDSSATSAPARLPLPRTLFPNCWVS